MKSAAVNAMKYIYHINSIYWDWFENEAYFQSCISDVLFIGFQDSLNDDFEVLKEILGLSKSVKLPEWEVDSYGAPQGLDKHLGIRSARN
jgi:hypothetical protein